MRMMLAQAEAVTTDAGAFFRLEPEAVALNLIVRTGAGAIAGTGDRHFRP